MLEQLQRRKEEELAEFRKRLDNFQLTDAIIQSGLDRIKRAFERGETELMFSSFPSNFCTDGGRAIINAGAPPINKPTKEELAARPDEPEWLETLPTGVRQGLRLLEETTVETLVVLVSRSASSTIPAGCRATSACSSPGLGTLSRRRLPQSQGELVMSSAKKAQKAEDMKQASTADARLKEKDYRQELDRLHVELVKLQQWVVYKGLKVCIVFEGRDGAGKGGTIKAITERVSSSRYLRGGRASRAHRTREIADVCPALCPAPAGGGRDRNLRPELVQPRRRGKGDGVLLRGAGDAVPWVGACR